MKKIIIGIAAGAVLALTTSGLMAGPARADTPAPTPTPTQIAIPVDCPWVALIGARGSGETGPGNKNWKPSKTDPYGLGKEVNTVRTQLLSWSTQNEIPFKTISVDYPASNVFTLAYPPLYFGGVSEGVAWTEAKIFQLENHCLDSVALILAGYSQGAGIMHRVVHDFINSNQASDHTIARQFRGTILIADMDQVKNDNELMYGGAPAWASGISHWLPKVSHASPEKFPASWQRFIMRVCFPLDPVCNATAADIDDLTVIIHFLYPGSAAVIAATKEAEFWYIDRQAPPG